MNSKRLKKLWIVWGVFFILTLLCSILFFGRGFIGLIYKPGIEGYLASAGVGLLVGGIVGCIIGFVLIIYFTIRIKKTGAKETIVRSDDMQVEEHDPQQYSAPLKEVWIKREEKEVWNKSKEKVVWSKSKEIKNRRPWWVKICLWGVSSRTSAWINFWASILCAIGFPIYCHTNPRLFYVGLLSIPLFGLVALWYWMAISWVDSAQQQLSKFKEMLDSGVIANDKFEARKAEMLSKRIIEKAHYVPRLVRSDGREIRVAEHFIIGRSLECSLQLQENAVSRQHALLEMVGQRVILKDLGSHNGTWLNGQKIRTAHELHDGDRLRIGKMEYIFREAVKPAQNESRQCPKCHQEIRQDWISCPYCGNILSIKEKFTPIHEESQIYLKGVQEHSKRRKKVWVWGLIGGVAGFLLIVMSLSLIIYFKIQSEEPGTVSALATGRSTLDVSVSPSEAGSVSPSSGQYDKGADVTLTAEPACGYKFDQWSGDASGSNSELTVTMNSNKSIVANFVETREQEEAYYELRYTNGKYELKGISVLEGVGGISLRTSKVIVEGIIFGTVRMSSGTRITLVAHPLSCYQFDRWSGDLSGNSPEITLIVNSDKDIVTNFSKIH